MHSRPPRGDRGPRAAEGCAPAPRDTHPGKGVVRSKPGPPSHRTVIPTPSSARGGTGESQSGERKSIGSGISPDSLPPRPPQPLCTDTGCVVPVPDTRAAPHAPGPQPCHTGRAQKWGALPRSPPHRPYRGFFNPLCSLGRLEVPQPSPPRPRRAQVAVTARSGCPSPTWVRRDVSARPARLRSPLRGLREAPGLTTHVRAASVSLWLSGFRGWEPLGHSPSRLLPRPSALMSPRRRSQWRLGTSAGPLGLRGSNQKARDPGSFVGGRFGP